MIERVRELSDTDDEGDNASVPSTSHHAKKDIATVRPITKKNGPVRFVVEASDI